jgi:hypothetical protein
LGASSLVTPRTIAPPWRKAGAANVERLETVPSVDAATPAAAPLKMVRRSIRDGVVERDVALDFMSSSIRLNNRIALEVAIPNEVS